MIPRTVREVAPFFLCAALLGALSLSCQGQVSVQEAGEGDVTFFAQHIAHDAVIKTDGSKAKGGRAFNRSLAAQIDLGLTNRLSLTVGLAYVFGKYTDTDPPPDPIPPNDLCKCLQGAWQDFVVTARYAALQSRRMNITPSISVVIPSHSYAYRGISAAGRDLRELAFAINANRRLDVLSRNAWVSGRYSYSVVEKALDVPLNRSNLSLQADYDIRRNMGLGRVGEYFVQRNLSLLGILLLQRTHGGLRRIGPDGSEVNTDDRKEQRDRLFRDNFLRLGGGALLSFGQTDVLGTVIFHVTGVDTHSERIFTIGVRRRFSLRPRDYDNPSSR